MTNQRLRILLSAVSLAAMGGALTLLSPEWTIALVPASIVVVVLLNLNPLVEIVIALASNHRRNPMS